MTLDLAKVSPQLRRMSQRLLDRREQLRLRLEYARATFAAWAARWEELRDLAEGRHNRAQRLASPREALDAAVPRPSLPPDHGVVATDGSQIEPDRHGPSEYYLLNIGWARLRYRLDAATRFESAMCCRGISREAVAVGVIRRGQETGIGREARQAQRRCDTD